MKITSIIWTKDLGWHKKKTVYYGLLSSRINWNFCIGIGYFTAYENDDIIVKAMMFPFIKITETYMKLNRDEKSK